jgi:hypothetical protein
MMNENQIVFKNPFEDRTTSSFEISIGTGLALESFFIPTSARYDDKRDIPVVIKPDDYKYHVYNIYTLARNILSACALRDKFQLINDKHFLPTVIEEIESIKLLYVDFKVTPVLFIPDYSTIFKKYNKEKDNITTNAFIDYDTMRKIFKNIKSNMDTVTETKLPATNDKVLILSNYTLDLLNYKNVPKLDLLESHTGKVKTRSEFNTKYHPIGKRDMTILPFTEKLLYMFGDKTLVKPVKIKLRSTLHQLAVDNNWNSKTTNDKIMFGINKNSNLVDIMKNFK